MAIEEAKPDEGRGNNVVQATFDGSTGMPAQFVASGLVAGNPAQTSVSGVVLDNSNMPIPGVTMHLLGLSQGTNGNVPIDVVPAVQTDSQGQFTLTQAPIGVFKLMADGTTAAVGTKKYPTLEFDVTTVAGRSTGVGTPIYLQNLDTVNQICVTDTTGGTLRLPDSPGFSLTVAPGSATFPGGSRSGCISATPVHMDKIPMAPGFGQQPRFILTIQPVGTTFNPPAKMTLPNVDGLAPRAVTEMYSYDHDLGSFVAIGTGTVSNDGTLIVSDPGVGVLKAGWHCGGPPVPPGCGCSCGTCSLCVAGCACVPDPSCSGNPGGPGGPPDCDDASISVQRTSLNQTTATGSPQPGTYSYNATLIDGDYPPSYQALIGPLPDGSPSVAPIVAPQNTSKSGIPTNGGLAELTATFQPSCGGQKSKKFNAAVFGLSCYMFATESDYPRNADGTCQQSAPYDGYHYTGSTTVTTKTPNGLPNGDYCNAFLAALVLNGSGFLKDGTAVHRTDGSVYDDDPSEFRFARRLGGLGGVPGPGTVASDPSVVPTGQTVQLDTGSVLADDIGSAIEDYRLDVFGGTGKGSCNAYPNRMSVGACSQANNRCPDTSIPDDSNQ